jgi:hypothetical protein
MQQLFGDFGDFAAADGDVAHRVETGFGIHDAAIEDDQVEGLLFAGCRGGGKPEESCGCEQDGRVQAEFFFCQMNGHAPWIRRSVLLRSGGKSRFCKHLLALGRDFFRHNATHSPMHLSANASALEGVGGSKSWAVLWWRRYCTGLHELARRKMAGVHEVYRVYDALLQSQRFAAYWLRLE